MVGLVFICRVHSNKTIHHFGHKATLILNGTIPTVTQPWHNAALTNDTHGTMTCYLMIPMALYVQLPNDNHGTIPTIMK
jgi:hypothetical protein